MLFRAFTILLPLILQQQGHVLANPLNHSVTQIHCTDSPNWIDPIFNRLDCDHALNQFLATTVTEHETTPFEFLAPGTHAIHTLPHVQTPVRITVGTCTLAIAMLASFAPGMLPGAGREPWPPTDIASFRDIYFTALAMDVQCTRRQGKAGWSHTGGRLAVGVFFWGTESRIDMVVRNRVQLLKPLELGNKTDNVSVMRQSFRTLKGPGGADQAGSCIERTERFHGLTKAEESNFFGRRGSEDSSSGFDTDGKGTKGAEESLMPSFYSSS